MEDYKIAVGMYQQYKNDVAKVGVGLNIFQIKTLQLLEENFRKAQPKKISFFQKLLNAFKNRK
jgi:beta-glucosidase/6-phospho-beta-glucosidase/beta-galactosidase